MTNLSFSQPMHCKRCWAYRRTSRSLCELHFLIFLSNRSMRSLASLSAVNPSKPAWKNRSWPLCPLFSQMAPVSRWFPDWTPCLFQQLGVWNARQFCYKPVRKGALQSSSPIFQDGTQTSLMWLSTYKVVQSDFFSWHPPPLKMALDWHSPPSPRFSELESHLLWQTLRRFSIRGGASLESA